MTSFFAFADEDRHFAVDQAIGGMEQGSRIGAPGSAPIPITDAHKTISSSQGTKKAEPSPVSVGENHGNIYSAPGQTNNPVNTVTTGSESTTGQTGTAEGGSSPAGAGETGSEQIINPVDTDTSSSQTEPLNNPLNNPSDIGQTGETPTGSGGSEPGTGETTGIGVSQPEAEPITNPIDSGTGTGTQTEEPNNPIVDVGAGVDLESGTVDADATVDTTGELEEKQIFEADLEVEGVGSIDADVNSAADITAEEVVEGADVKIGETTETIQPAAETVQPAARLPDGQGQAGTESPPTESTQESNPIVDVGASADLESGKVETDATIDTSGELEEKQIIDADLGAGETTTGAEVGSAADVTQSDIVQSADVTTQPVQSVIPIPSDLTAEVDTTGETSGGEADVGVEADVEGISEGEDVTCDPADGLTSSACGLPQL